MQKGVAAAVPVERVALVRGDGCAILALSTHLSTPRSTVLQVESESVRYVWVSREQIDDGAMRAHGGISLPVVRGVVFIVRMD